MDVFPIDIFHLLLFTIPGFFIVWSFRKVNGENKINDFEYLMFSVFWGVILLAFFGSQLPKEKLNLILSNPYAGCLIFSIFGIFFGNGIGQLTKNKDFFIIIYTKIIKLIKRK